MPTARILICLLLPLLGLAGCARDRPLETPCPRLAEFTFPRTAVTATAQAGTDDLNAMMAGAFMADGAGEAPIAPNVTAAPAPGLRPNERFTDALILSGGGQWGAYGAGVIEGWSAHGRLPARITTGISTGALQASFAYLGPTYDPQLIAAYTIANESELVDRHGDLFFLRHGSMADTAPLKTYIQTRIGPVLDAVAAEHDRSGRALIVGAVDALEGTFKVFDLGAMASTLEGSERLNCYTAALLASAAVPAVFRQTTINDRPWLDGGVRRAFLIPETVKEIVAAKAMASGMGVMVKSDNRIYALRNGTVAPEAIEALEPKLLPTLGRLRTIVFNQVDQDSIDLAAIFAERAGLALYTTTADGWGAQPRLKPCTNQDPAASSAIFDPAFMACLIAYGRSQWQDGRDPWREYRAP